MLGYVKIFLWSLDVSKEIRTWHFGRTTDGERMPLVLRDLGYIHVHIVARLMVEVFWFLDHQVRYLGGTTGVLLKTARNSTTASILKMVKRYNFVDRL